MRIDRDKIIKASLIAGIPAIAVIVFTGMVTSISGFLYVLLAFGFGAFAGLFVKEFDYAIAVVISAIPYIIWNIKTLIELGVGSLITIVGGAVIYFMIKELWK